VTNDWRVAEFADPAMGLGLRIVNVEDPAAPVELSAGYSGYGPLDAYSDYYTSQVAAAGGYVYLNYVTFLGDGRQDHLCVVDVSNAPAPALFGCYDGIGEIRDITAAGKHVYVASSEALFIIAAANPLEVHQVSLADTWSATVVGDYIYVAAGQEGLYILGLQLTLQWE